MNIYLEIVTQSSREGLCVQHRNTHPVVTGGHTTFCVVGNGFMKLKCRILEKSRSGVKKRLHCWQSVDMLVKPVLYILDSLLPF